MRIHITMPRPRVTRASHGHGDDLNGHAAHAGHDPHESPSVMLWPLYLLALGAVFAGFAFEHLFVGEGRAGFWGESLYTAPGHDSVGGSHGVPMWVGPCAPCRGYSWHPRGVDRLQASARYSCGGHAQHADDLQPGLPQVLFRRALPRAVRAAGALARPAILEGRGRGDHRWLRAE